MTDKEEINQLRQAQANQADKMEAVGRLAGGIAHDLNNLLTAINGYSQLLDRVLTDETPRRYVEEIRKAGQKATEMTSNLLRISRRQVVHPEVIDLRQMILQREIILSNTLGPDVQLKLQLAPDLFRVETDPAQFDSALLNLAVNAREAMPDGGELTLSGNNKILEQASSHLPPGAYVHLEVKDNGVGMSPEILPHVFEPLYTTKDKSKGAGFGLAVVYAAVARSHGHIDIESEPGKGTTFNLYLPRAEELPRTEELAQSAE